MKLTDYETAKALKELGFDEECRHYYVSLTGEPSPEVPLDFPHGNTANNSDYPNFPVCPYLPQASDFLREQYGVHVTVEPRIYFDDDVFQVKSVTFDEWLVKIFTEDKFIVSPSSTDGEFSPDHDTAYQEGIKKGIEIVKEEC